MAQSDTFKFPKVVLARTSGEVGTLCTVLSYNQLLTFFAYAL